MRDKHFNTDEKKQDYQPVWWTGKDIFSVSGLFFLEKQY